MRFLNGVVFMAFLMDKAGGGDGGGGSGGGSGGGQGQGQGDNKGGQGQGQGGSGGGSDDITALKNQNAELLKRLEALEGKGKGGEPDPKDQDLADKARLKREEDEKRAQGSKALESAIKFNVRATEWLKTNETLLPKSVAGIFQAAEKENFDGEIEKANAIKVGIVQEFFSVQSNLDLLTESQKNALEDFRNLTKTVKQERVGQVFDNIFEPTFEQLKRIKKAEQVSKGLGDRSSTEDAYLSKLASKSRKHYLGEKTDA